jgi:hypothetical protein
MYTHQWMPTFWRNMAVFTFRAKDGDSMFLWNVGIYQCVNMPPNSSRTTSLMYMYPWNCSNEFIETSVIHFLWQNRP